MDKFKTTFSSPSRHHEIKDCPGKIYVQDGYMVLLIVVDYQSTCSDSRPCHPRVRQLLSSSNSNNKINVQINCWNVATKFRLLPFILLSRLRWTGFKYINKQGSFVIVYDSWGTRTGTGPRTSLCRGQGISYIVNVLKASLRSNTRNKNNGSKTSLLRSLSWQWQGTAG